MKKVKKYGKHEKDKTLARKTVSMRKTPVTDKTFIMQKALTDILHEDDTVLDNNLANFKATLKSEINAKCRELQRSRKQKEERAFMIAAYVVFTLLLFSAAWNFLVCGFGRVLQFVCVIVATASFVLLCCIPIILKFKTNIFERGSYQNETQKI